MKTILTSDEISAIVVEMIKKPPTAVFWCDLARAIEAAVLAKLAQQEPVAVVGDVWMLNWVGNGPIAPIIEKHGIQIGDHLYTHPAPQQADRQRVPDGWREALAECADLAWLPESHAVRFDSTVVFSEFYDFDNLESPRREEFLAQYECVVWPGRKWSAYCTYEGSMWFEQFDTAEEAKEACMRLLDKVLPDHPAMKARAMLASAPEAPAQASAVDERAAFEAWAADYALRHEPNYSKATEDDCWAAWQARAALAQKGGAA